MVADRVEKLHVLAVLEKRKIALCKIEMSGKTERKKGRKERVGLCIAFLAF